MRAGWWALIVVVAIGIILTPFLVGFSFGIVRPNELVLVRNRLNQKLYYEEAMQTAGPHYVGVQSVLVRFPANNILVEFSNTINDNSTENATQLANQNYTNRTLGCWTQDGLDVFIDVNFYYKLNRNRLLWFYKEFGDDWKDLVEQLARRAIKETTVLYPSSFYYTNRTLLQASFQAAIQNSYDQETNGTVGIQYFQIQYIGFGGGFEDAIVTKLVQQHYYNLYNYQGQINLINANTTVYSNNTFNKINLTLANATATGLENDLELKSKSLVNYLQNMTAAYSAIRNLLGVTWTQMYPLMYAIELKTSAYARKPLVYVPKTVQRVMNAM